VNGDGEYVNWYTVRSGRNTDFDEGDRSELPINRYLSNIFREMKRYDPRLSEVYLALTWSNGLQAAPPPSGVAGVGALVSGVASGSYRKGEPFTQGLSDGFNLGAAVAQAAAAHGVRLKALVIANDTIYTANSHPGSSAGVICSTGANGTLIIPDSQGRRMLFNAESGGTFTVSQEWLSDGETSHVNASRQRVVIEDLCAGLESATHGLGVGRLLSINVKHLANQRGARKLLGPVAEVIDQHGLGVFDGRAVTFLAKGDFAAFQGLKPCFASFEQASLTALQATAVAIEKRAGVAAALLSYVSVARDVSAAPQCFTVALDSRIADGSAIFRAAYEATLQHLLAGNDVTVVYKKAKNGITVPTQGGASSLDQILQRERRRQQTQG
jgi:hypothetical protein